MPTIRDGIYDLLQAVEIDTKEAGRSHVEPWPSQRLVIDSICQGLSEGVHEFVILKCRQVAATTICSVIELFWALCHAGTQGAIIADRTDNLERLRRIFASLLETLPPEWRGPEHRLTQNNRAGLAFANRSVIDLMAAAGNANLGASRALNMAHMTECSLWTSLSGVESLKASLARQNPNRLYCWESVANGFGNWFYGHCQQAKIDRHMRFIFLGFFLNPTYSIPQSDPDYTVYWDGSLTDSEVNRARYVRQHYNYTITPSQIAWWRRESEFRAEEYMLRHYPWTEEECFISTGSSFFPARRTLELARALTPSPPYLGYKYTFDEEFLKSKIERTQDRDEVNLKVWEPPEPGGIYTIGIDPSGGGGGEADLHCIIVMRCYADRIVQVAEFASNYPLTYQLAWVMAHLAGAYREHTANIEITGIGAAVLPELRNLRALALRSIMQGKPGGDPIIDMIGAVRWFLYKRPDSLGGVGNVIAWKTNPDNRRQIYDELRNTLIKGELEVRSPLLVGEMQAVVYDEGWVGLGPDTGKDDNRVTALVLAVHPWVETWRDILVARGMTWDSVKGTHPPQTPAHVLSDAFSRHMQSINQKARRRVEKF